MIFVSKHAVATEIPTPTRYSSRHFQVNVISQWIISSKQAAAILSAIPC